eukprot:gi/632940694/ref/XP_007885456.1/ PREDICTED: alpha-N-acetylgalactosaminide alpha-2,6-sialyltransferase 5 isoform X1 [Callorhinchus milii]
MCDSSYFPEHSCRRSAYRCASQWDQNNGNRMKRLVRHAIVVLLGLFVCGSFLVIYSSNRDQSTQSQPYRGEEESRGKQRHTQPQSSLLHGYINFIDHKPLKIHCKNCALVTSSGHLTGSNRGTEIDETDCVIRMNDAPTRGYRKDVGQKTSLRVIAHSSIQRILQKRNELLNVTQDPVFVFWGPSNYMKRDGKGLVYNHLQLIHQILPKLNIYTITRQKMLYFDELFKRETGKDRKTSNSWLSTGWFTMIIALEFCDRINIYGMVPPTFCRNPHHQSVPYHYYEPLGPDECTMYISHERGQKGSHHRFITEKRVFAGWAQRYNIHFYQPDWRPESISVNHTEYEAKL